MVVVAVLGEATSCKLLSLCLSYLSGQSPETFAENHMRQCQHPAKKRRC
jgi:hypothetical protein